MKKLFTLLSIFTLSLTSASVHANTVTIPNDPATALSPTNYLPTALNTGTANSAGTFSVSQQLYFASELSAASSTTITAITFYCNNGLKVNRKLRVWMNNTSITAFPTSPTEPNFVDPGTFVYSSKKGDTDSGVDIVRGEEYTLTFDTPFEWNGTSNIIVTVFDSTGATSGYLTPHDMIRTEGVARFLHQRTLETNYANAGWNMSSLTSSTARYSNDRGYVNKITFTFAAPAAVAPSTPEGLAVSNVGATTASLSWTAVDGATSYKLYHSTSAEGSYSELASPTTNSYNWTSLTASTTYYVKVSAVNGVGESALSEPISFTTQSPHIHDGITFEPWSNPSAMPTSGNYYLANDVELDQYDPTTITLTGNLNLCLNGNTANLYGTKIVVPSSNTLTIYDNVGGGKITGFVASEVGAYEIYAKALIAVHGGGTLILKEGTIENTYIPDEDGLSYAIYSNGTIHLSGDVLINSNSADIYLYASNIITLDGAISNAEKHTVYKNGGAFTSGWSTYMSGEDPRDYFESANTARSVYYNGSEAALRLLLNLSESSNNSAISTYSEQLIDVSLTRSLTSSQYNTFCLPFALTNAELQSAFGAGYDLQEFVSSSLVDETLELTFNKVNALEAGKPYLLKPSVDVANPIFPNVTITATSPVDQTSDTYISFYGIYSPTELEGGNKNILFLGAENELFWPETTENLKGFRAYFELKGGAAKVAKRARIINKEEAPTSLDEVQGNNLQRTKYIENGQLFILYNGTKYNVQGQVIK